MYKKNGNMNVQEKCTRNNRKSGEVCNAPGSKNVKDCNFPT